MNDEQKRRAREVTETHRPASPRGREAGARQPGAAGRGAAPGGGEPGRSHGGAGRGPVVGHRRSTLPPELARRTTGAARTRSRSASRSATPLAAIEEEAAGEVPPEELAFDVRQALLKAPATRRLDDLAERLAWRLARR